MSRIREIYRLLRSVNDASVDRAMAAALPTADPLAVQLIALSLLERDHPDGTLALVTQFHRLPGDLQQTVVRHVQDLYRPLREAASKGDITARLNMVQIVREARATRLAYLVIGQLRRNDPTVRQAAADCIAEMAAWADTCNHSASRTDAASAAFLQTAVEEAMDTYASHEHPAVTLAYARLLPRPMAHVAETLADARHRAVEALRCAIEETSHPELRRATICLMQIPTLTSVAVNSLPQITVNGDLGDVLRLSHLLLDRKVSALLFKLNHANRVAPDPMALEKMTPAQLRALPRWIAALPIDPAQKVHKLAPMTGVTDAPARLAGLHQLMTLSRDSRATGASTVIADFCQDHDPVLARIALRFLVSRKYDGLVQLLLKLVNSPHPEIRSLAGEELAPLGFDRLWSAWPRLTAARQLAAGRALIKIDAGFHRTLARKLDEPDREARMRALMIIYRLSQGAFFVDALKVLIKDNDERVASAAARALGTADKEAAASSLQEALDHPDSRVRANAVEALYEMDAGDHIERLREMAQSDDNRPRANAIGVLLDLNIHDAFDALNDMLSDQRAEQRVSALWLIQRMDLVEVAQHVAEISISDADPKVRQRAANVIRHLISTLETDQTDPAESTTNKPETAA